MPLDSLSQLYSQRHHPVFTSLFGVVPFNELSSWPSADELNELAPGPFRYICDPAPDSDAGMLLDKLGYEGFIHQTQSIPTRRNWHDAFNAAIWHQFPSTKQRLNQLHIAYIARHGALPRGKVRDHITHFDECGIIIAHTPSCPVPQQLLQHQWQAALVDNQQQWGNRVQAFVFGHANLEMLLNPHIGLTGKWVEVEVPDGFFVQRPSLQVALLDALLARRIDEAYFANKLPPIPFLGIPGWWQEQDANFYANTEYFRPKKQRPKR
ncbi:MAG: DUF3025 domain-containing protein [Glaciecola sp.]|jgi:hypothetical protein|nr:DUF3025 domain-containing protein [Glaciecola sp.]MDG1816737.1 DUF3025 domain-containing protein [Glaciecola sp.]MDG2099664.1 DUF3025 domain-containing protein [Glaciecola sp.]